MREIKEQVPKEVYDDYAAMSYKDRSRLIESRIPKEWILGYGYYGHRLERTEDKYFIVHSVGSSCD